MSSLLPLWIRTYHDLEVTPVLGAFRAASDEPPEYTLGDPNAGLEGLLPLTFWVNRRPVASRWYKPKTYKKVMTSPVFGDALSLVLLAGAPLDARGWMRIDVGAIPRTDKQFWDLLDLRRMIPDLPVDHVAGGRIAMMLGHHWVPISAEFVEAVTDQPDVALDLLKRCGDEAFVQILIGNDEEVAARFLESIPGLRGERAEPDS